MLMKLNQRKNKNYQRWIINYNVYMLSLKTFWNKKKSSQSSICGTFNGTWTRSQSDFFFATYRQILLPIKTFTLSHPNSRSDQDNIHLTSCMSQVLWWFAAFWKWVLFPSKNLIKTKDIFGTTKTQQNKEHGIL